MAAIVQGKASVLALIAGQADVLASMGVRRLGLFGSFVRDEADAESDVDFLVEFETDHKTFDNFMRLSFFLEDLLQRRVELVTPQSLSPYIGPCILEEVEYVSISS